MTHDPAFLHAWQREHALPPAIGPFPVLERVSGERSGNAVYRARDPVSGEEVVIKVAGDPLDSFEASVIAPLLEEHQKAMLRQEARLLAKLRHPHIVAFRAAGEDPAYGPYLALEWVAGGSLRACLDRSLGGRLPSAEAIGIAGGVLAGLGAVHAAGLVHLDVTPANILLDGRGRAKLTDFGEAAELRSGLVYQGQGTPGYVAPEQDDPRAFRTVGPTADIYSLGVVLFEMLAGRRPDPEEGWSHPPPGLPEGIVAILTRAIHPEPARRFPSAREMAAALEEAETTLL